MKILIFILLVFVVCACDQKRIYEENIEIKEGIWNRENKIKFNVDIKDTITPHNLYVNIRNAGEYPFRNIYLFITTSSKGIVVKDTFEAVLADEKGKWLGSGLGDLWDNQLVYKKNIRFPHSGIYVFEYEQGMRTENLPYIMDVGLRIEKIK
jgi:gliding motility-associated lipoprotein GldH